MAWRIVTKNVHGKEYFYAKSSSHKEPTAEKFLGTADDIVAIIDAFHNPPPPVVVDREFGTVAALWSVAERLDVINILDANFPKRNSGPSVGTYLVVGAISRCLEPISKRATPDWYEKTILPSMLEHEAKCFSSQRFWDNCHELEPDQLEQAQVAIAKQAVEVYDLYTGKLLYDSTNYDTYLDTNNPSKLAQRGHAKSHRSDLKIVGVAAMVTQDGHVPLFHEAFSGNRHDSGQFKEILPKLAQTAEKLCFHEPEITIVLDKGNNAKDNWELLNDTPFHFVGCLPVSDYPELLEIPFGSFDELNDPELEGCLAYRSTEKVWGDEYEVVVTYNPELYFGQMQGIAHNIAQCQKEFDYLKARLARWQSGEVKKGRKPTIDSVKEQVKKILNRQYMKNLWRVEVTTNNSLPDLTVQFDQEALEKLQKTVLGKTIVFTDHCDWTNDEIISCYRSQWRIEEMFRWSKDRRRNSWEPTYHWTDPMIRVHTFCCMLGLTLTALLLRELNQNDFHLSQRTLFDHLEGIKETEITYPAVGRFAAVSQTVLHHLNGIQQGLFHQLNLQQFCAKPISSSKRPSNCTFVK